MRVVLAFTLVCLVVLIAGGSSAESDTTSSESAGQGCPGFDVSLPHPATVVFGRVAFAADPKPGWEQGDAVDNVDRYPHGRFFSKFGLLVRGPGEIVLRVRAPVWMKGWSGAGKSRVTTVVPCADRGWRAIPGGFLIPRPHRCVRLRVTVGDRKTKVPFGLGQDC